LRALGTPELAGRCLRIGLGPVAVAGALIGVALYHAGGLLAVLAPLLPAAALSDAVLAATRGYRSMRPTVVYDRIVRPALQLAGLATLAWLNAGAPCTTISLCKVPFQTPGLVAFACAWALPYAPTLALAALALHRLTTASPRSWTAEPAIGGPGVQDRERPELSVRAFWAFSAPRAVAGVAQLALNRVDVVLVAALAGLPAAALYTVAGRFVVLGQFVNQAISQAIQPRLAESLATADLPAAKRLYQQGTAWLVLATWPLYLLVGAYAPVYLALFGPHYAVGATITALLAAAGWSTWCSPWAGAPVGTSATWRSRSPSRSARTCCSSPGTGRWARRSGSPPRYWPTTSCHWPRSGTRCACTRSATPRSKPPGSRSPASAYPRS
jgi:O-antigen/teichoic acid export membrane protein